MAKSVLDVSSPVAKASAAALINDCAEQNRTLFAFAAYNAGPGRIKSLRREAEVHKLDPNVWFNNVEQVAAARVGQETVRYVRNIYKYYIAYKLIEEDEAADNAALSAIKAPVTPAGSPSTKSP